MNDNFKTWCYWFKDDNTSLFVGPMCYLKGTPISDCIDCTMAKDRAELNELKQSWVKSMNKYIEKRSY